MEFEEDGIVVTFKISEGPRFKVGKVDFSGDLILPKERADEEAQDRQGALLQPRDPAQRRARAHRPLQRTRATPTPTSPPRWIRTTKSCWPTSPSRSTRASRSTSSASRSAATPRPATR
ncbi:MAG: hypothetical protein MZV70_07420 [Desulfobacterales bacterium]|nr:hypothetical protein [Desulfobacterales bacterium]